MFGTTLKINVLFDSRCMFLLKNHKTLYKIQFNTVGYQLDRIRFFREWALLVTEFLLSVSLFHLAVFRRPRKHKENKKSWGLLEIWCCTLMFEPGFPAIAVKGLAWMWKCTYITALHCSEKQETEVWDCSAQYTLHWSRDNALATSASYDALGLGLMIYYWCKQHY